MRGGRWLILMGCAVGCGGPGGSESATFPGLGPTASASAGETEDPSTSGPSADEDEEEDDDGTTGGPSIPAETEEGPGLPCAGLTCSANASCIDEECVCDSGYEGDGLTCIDIDGCVDEPCFPGTACADVPAPGQGFDCGACPPGYEGDGIDCTDVDGCAAVPCFAGVECTDVAAPGEGYTCGACPTGYEGDGETCSDIDGCAGAPCFMGVACTDVAAPGEGFTCGDCPDGTFGDGETCGPPQLYVIGDTPTSFATGPYFRGNGYVADDDGLILDFDVYLGRGAACNVDFYVFEGATPAGALTQVWRNTVAAPAGTGYINSGTVDVAVTDGDYYVLGIGWNCTATYYYNPNSAWVDFDAGVGIFNNNRWDNAYPGPSDPYVPPSTGTNSTTYPHRVLWAGP